MSEPRKLGDWTILGDAPSRGKRRYLLCQCSCGTKREVRADHIANGVSRSCGHGIARRHHSVMQAAFDRKAPTTSDADMRARQVLDHSQRRRAAAKA
jgi:hypothetical protein